VNDKIINHSFWCDGVTGYHQARLKVRVKLTLQSDIWLGRGSISSMQQFTSGIYCKFKTIFVAMVVSLVVICCAVGM